MQGRRFLHPPERVLHQGNQPIHTDERSCVPSAALHYEQALIVQKNVANGVLAGQNLLTTSATLTGVPSLIRHGVNFRDST